MFYFVGSNTAISTLPAFGTPFFLILNLFREGAPRRPLSAARFASRPRAGESLISGCALPTFRARFGQIGPSLSNQCRQAPERGRGGFRMGRTQPHGIAGVTEPSGPRFSGCVLCFTYLPGPLWVRPLGLAQDFVVWGIQCPWGASLWLLSTGSAGRVG